MNKDFKSNSALATLFFWHDQLIWTSETHTGGDTSRPYISILISGRNELHIGHNNQTFSGRALAIGASVIRSVVAESGFYSLNLDPIHPISPLLRQYYFEKAPIWDLSHRLSPEHQEQVYSHLINPQGCLESRQLSNSLLKALFPEIEKYPTIDERVRMVADWLRRNLPNKSYMDELCSISGLSSGRLSHLFTHEMGTSIKSYLLVMKMRRAAELFGQSVTLTDIAHEMGFSDSAHLTRAFQAHFSVPPSLLTNPGLVDVHVCEAICE